MTSKAAALRILLLVPEYPPDTIGGGGVVFEALRREYAMRHHVRVMSGSAGAPTDAGIDLADGVLRVREIPLPANLRYLATTMPPTPIGFRRLSRAIRDVDVVHAHGFGFPVVDVGIRLAAHRHIPVLQTLHGFPISQTRRGAIIKGAFIAYHRFSGFPALRRAQAHTAVSESVSDLYRRRYRLPVTTVFNGADLPGDADWPEFDSLLGQGRRLVVSVGRLEWIKGLDSIIRSLSLLPDNLQPLVVFIGADHGAGTFLQKLARDTGVGHLCHFVGQQSRGRVGHAYRRADACVVASHTEAFPAVPLEAMLAGTAVITSRLAGMAAYAVEGVNCEMFKSGDEKELAAKLTRLLTYPHLRSTLVAGGLAAAARFTWPDIARQYELILAGLCDGASLSAGRQTPARGGDSA
jgi:glycosyltransferase involved in cell wall biosynthesis